MTLIMKLLCILQTVAYGLYALALSPERIRADLTSNLSQESQVVLTSDVSYLTDFRKRFTAHADTCPSYSVAVKPATEEDIQTIVRYAAENRVPFLATGGGHGYSTVLGRVRDVLNVDLSNFNSVSVDAKRNTMTVGCGTRFAQIYDPLYNAGKQIQTGGCSQPSMIGVTLGGGIGPLAGAQGLIIDALLSAEIVTGTGDLLVVSKTQNPDLFWGIRGAGFNFGIVTSATYRIVDATPEGQVYNADLVYSGEKNGTIFEMLSSFQQEHDDKLALTVVSSLKNNTPSISVSAIYFGTEEAGKAAIEAFLDAEPAESYISMVPYNQLVYVANFGSDSFTSQKEVLADTWGFNVNKLDVPSLISVYNELMSFALNNPPHSSVKLILEKFGPGVTSSIPDDATAFPWRKTLGYGMLTFSLPDATTPYQGADIFAQGLRSKLTWDNGNPYGEVYVHYARGDEAPEQMYGARKLPKLRMLKAKYDPNGLFNFYNSVQ